MDIPQEWLDKKLEDLTKDGHISDLRTFANIMVTVAQEQEMVTIGDAVNKLEA